MKYRSPSVAYWLIVLLVGLTGCQHQRAVQRGQGEIDSRIAYYGSRIGGPASYPAEARLGLAYLQKARDTGETKYHDEALHQLLNSLKHQPNFEAFLGAALVYLERHEFAKALKYAEEAAETMPGSVDAQGVLFDSLLALGQSERASNVVETLTRSRPGFAAFTREAAWRSSSGDLRGAVESMRRACEYAAQGLSAGTRAWAEVRLGSLHIANCEGTLARRSYERALKLQPGYYLALEHLAELDAAKGRRRKAIGIYRGLLKRLPEPKYRLAVAELYTSGGELEKARREQRQAMADLRAAVANGSKAELRELALELLESSEDAKQGLEMALRDWQNRKDATAADTLAWGYFRTGNMDKALKYSQQAIKSGTKDPQILLHAGLIRLRAGRVEEAKMLLAEVRACALNLTGTDRIRAEKAWAALASVPAKP